MAITNTETYGNTITRVVVGTDTTSFAYDANPLRLSVSTAAAQSKGFIAVRLFDKDGVQLKRVKKQLKNVSANSPLVMIELTKQIDDTLSPGQTVFMDNGSTKNVIKYILKARSDEGPEFQVRFGVHNSLQSLSLDWGPDPAQYNNFRIQRTVSGRKLYRMQLAVLGDSWTNDSGN